MIIVLMGVSGSGKSTIGALLAARLNWTFLEGDDFHPPANISKMSSGIALSDEDRFPWLGDIAKSLRARAERGENIVLSCSALKERYRTVLRQAATDVRFVFLEGREELIAERVRKRSHFMNPALLRSQFEALEPPVDAVRINVALAATEIVELITRTFSL